MASMHDGTLHCEYAILSRQDELCTTGARCKWLTLGLLRGNLCPSCKDNSPYFITKDLRFLIRSVKIALEGRYRF
jgi:hypothetical protein